jgi:hypothetical protein
LVLVTYLETKLYRGNDVPIQRQLEI